MNKLRLLASIMIIAMLGSMLTGCGSKTAGTSTTNSTETKDTAAASAYPGTPDENAITVNIESEPPQLFSVKTTDAISQNVLRQVTDNLVSLDESDKVIPGVAKDWTVSDDGLVYTFNLRDDMKWTNGEPVTANDFVFAWTALLDPKFAAEYAYFGYVFKNGQAFNEGSAKKEDLGFKALSDYQLEITLQNPTPYFLNTLAYEVFAPVNEKAYNEFGEAYGTEADKMVFNGPYKITSWEHENKIVLEKNPDYYDADKVTVNTVNLVMITDTNAALNSFKAGELDMTIINGDGAKMLSGENYPVNTYDDGACAYLQFNLTNQYLKNANLRNAIAAAVNGQAFVDSVLKNHSQPAKSFTPPCINGLKGKFSDEVGVTIPAFDPAKAKEYYAKALEELGTDKIELGLVIDDSDTAVNSGAFIQEQLKTNLGLEVKVESMPFKSRIERMTNKDFDIVMALWGPDYNDPMTFLDLFETNGGNNHGSYSNPTYDDLLDKVRTELDPTTRFGYLKEIEKLVVTDLPVSPIYWRARDFVVSGKVGSGLYRTAFQDINLRYVTIAK